MKKLGLLGGALVCLLMLTACTGEESRMRTATEEWLGSGQYQTDGEGRVEDGMSERGRDLTEGAKDAVDEARQGVMDAGRDMKQAADDAGQDLKRAVGK